MLRVQLLSILSFVATSFVCALPADNVISSGSDARNIFNVTDVQPRQPVVDLDYALHQGDIDESEKYYTFSNIRYAAPPVGKNRFAAPVKPAVNRTLNDGRDSTICAQASPFWGTLMIKKLAGVGHEQLEKDERELEALEASLTIDTIQKYQPVDPRTSEDCLFLDVIVPVEIFDDKKSAPVLVWIYGGGYVGGDKTSSGNPKGLLAKAQENGEGAIFVAMNYRLGLFGWLSGSTFASQGGLPNAALYDQRFALEWVQKYIHLFGGDASRVTVIGESAGAGSIMHHITAWGSKNPAPFQQAILQSPGYIPISTNSYQENTYNSVILHAQKLIDRNISTTDDLRNLDFTTLVALNKILVAQSTPYGTFTFGPAVDGNYVPKLPSHLMKEGKSAQPLKVLVAHNSDEGYLFTPPDITDSMIDFTFNSLFVQTSSENERETAQKLWPAVYDGSKPYRDPAGRAALIISEVSFACLSRFTAITYPNSSYAYRFAMPPGYHSFDVPYTFYSGDQDFVNSTVAHTMQSLITNFAKNGDPNGPGVSHLPTYLPGSKILVLSNSSIDNVQTDELDNERCAWLQNATFAT